MVVIVNDDCLKALKAMESNSVDSVVTDPPYGLAFMGKKWDYDVPSTEVWGEVLRVLKPGGHLLAFAGSRTYHRMAVNIEDAGFEIRDQIMWLYGSGFPKSMNISKKIDKHLGAEREKVRKPYSPQQMLMKDGQNERPWQNKARELGYHEADGDKPATPQAEQWDGWGTALKPAHEPIVVARKPLIGTVVENVLEHGTGGLNIDESRVATNDNPRVGNTDMSDCEQVAFGKGWQKSGTTPPEGRFPANVIHDGSEEVLGGFPNTSSGNAEPHHITRESQSQSMSGKNYANRNLNTYGDKGSAARFFYCAKTSKKERDAGCDDIEAQQMGRNQSSLDGGKMLTGSGNERSNLKNNFHPTVKPIALMEYLCRLITPPNGVILDPFMGSGTTGIAACRLGFDFIGVEISSEYTEIARKRISYWTHVSLEEEYESPKNEVEWI